MVGATAMLAVTDERARYLYTSQQQHFLGVVRGNLSFAPPVGDMDAVWTETEKMHIDHMTAEAIVGSPQPRRRVSKTWWRAPVPTSSSS